MKTTLRLAVVAGGLATVALSAPAGARPAWDAIPAHDMPLHSDVPAPASVSSGETVEGLAVTSTGQKSGSVGSSDRRCLTHALAGTRSVDERGQPVLQLFYDAVDTVRAERLVVEGDRASLEIVDAWIDSRTRGARLASRTVVPLSVLAKGPEGFAVYGFRHGTTLEVVVPAPYSMMYLDKRGAFSSSACGHVRVPLAAVDGATAELVGQIDVTPRARKRPAVVAQAMAQVGVEEEKQAKATRSLQISASASQMSADPAPVVSVILAFADDEPIAQPEEPRRFRGDVDLE